MLLTLSMAQSPLRAVVREIALPPLRSFAAVNQLPEGLKASMQEHLRLSFANEDIADERVLGE